MGALSYQRELAEQLAEVEKDPTKALLALGLRPDEIVFLQGARCGCGHLYSLHNTHCCQFCMVDGCECED